MKYFLKGEGSVYFLLGVLLPSQDLMCFFILFYLYLVMSKKIANTTCAQASFSSVALTNVGITLCHTCTTTENLLFM